MLVVDYVKDVKGRPGRVARSRIIHVGVERIGVCL